MMSAMATRLSPALEKQIARLEGKIPAHPSKGLAKLKTSRGQRPVPEPIQLFLSIAWKKAGKGFSAIDGSGPKELEFGFIPDATDEFPACKSKPCIAIGYDELQFYHVISLEDRGARDPVVYCLDHDGSDEELGAGQRLSKLLASLEPEGSPVATSAGLETLDPGLAKALKETLEGKKLTPKVLAGLRQFYAAGSPIQSIQGLQLCVGLTEISLDCRELQDLSPLMELPKLKRLRLNHGSSPKNVAIIQKLAALESLDLGGELADLFFVGALPRLQELGLHECGKVSDLGPLAAMKALRRLDIGDGQVRYLTPLKGLTRLEELYLMSHRITDLEPLRALVNLRELGLSRNEGIKSLDPVEKLTKLERLIVAFLSVEDLEPLAGLKSLRTLWLQGNQIRDLSPLAGLKKLDEVRLARNPIDPKSEANARVLSTWKARKVSVSGLDSA
jgi:hypothetical protein